MAHTLADVTAAANDPHLRDRLVSAAAEAGIDAPEQWVATRMRLLAAAPVNASGDTVASVYAYAAGADAAAARGKPGCGHRQFPSGRAGARPAVMPTASAPRPRALARGDGAKRTADVGQDV